MLTLMALQEHPFPLDVSNCTQTQPRGPRGTPSGMLSPAQTSESRSPSPNVLDTVQDDISAQDQREASLVSPELEKEERIQRSGHRWTHSWITLLALCGSGQTSPHPRSLPSCPRLAPCDLKASCTSHTYLSLQIVNFQCSVCSQMHARLCAFELLCSVFLAPIVGSSSDLHLPISWIPSTPN